MSHCQCTHLLWQWMTKTLELFQGNLFFNQHVERSRSKNSMINGQWMKEWKTKDDDVSDWWLRQPRICLQWGRPGFDSWVGKIPWRREWLPTPIFSAGEFHVQRIVAGYSPWRCKELDMTELLKFFTFRGSIAWWIKAGSSIAWVHPNFLLAVWS